MPSLKLGGLATRRRSTWRDEGKPMVRFSAALLLAILPLAASAYSRPATSDAHYLFVWAGDQAKQGNDFLAVIDANPVSPTYGKLMTSVGTNVKSVRPHHTEYQMPASGMLFANDHDGNQTTIIDLREPLRPRETTSFGSMAGYSMAHSFLRLPNGHVLASFQFADKDGSMAMNAKTGGLVEIDDGGKVIRSASNADPAFTEEGLLPYSLVVLPKIDRVLVTNSPMGDAYLLTSNTYQVFRLTNLKLLGTYRFDPGPNLHANIDPEEPRVGPDGAVFVQTLSCAVQRVTGLDSPRPTARFVHQFPGEDCGVPTIVGHYLVQSVPAIHGYVVLDVANGSKPVEVSRLTISSDYAPHWTGWDAKSHRLVITSKQKEDRMFLLKLDDATGALSIDTAFCDTDGKIGFSFAGRAWPHGWTGDGQPHGAVFSR
ncbi:MAG: hypothetical protein ABIO80_06700 [Sphingomicrobium sp.]